MTALAELEVVDVVQDAVDREVAQELAGTAEVKSEELADHLTVLAAKKRTSATYRRNVEDTLVEYLLASEAPADLEPIQAAQWIAGVNDRRMREPILKRIHNHVQPLAEAERVNALESARLRLVALIQAAPSRNTAALCSMLALFSWQAGEICCAKAEAHFGLTQNPDNVLLLLVEGAASVGLPTSDWHEVMDTYSLTKLRAG